MFRGKNTGFFFPVILGLKFLFSWFGADQGPHSLFWELIWRSSRRTVQAGWWQEQLQVKAHGLRGVGGSPFAGERSLFDISCRHCCLQPLGGPFTRSGALSVAAWLVVGARASICCSWWFVWAFIPPLCCLWQRTALEGLWSTVISGCERVLAL